MHDDMMILFVPQKYSNTFLKALAIFSSSQMGWLGWLSRQTGPSGGVTSFVVMIFWQSQHSFFCPQTIITERKHNTQKASMSYCSAATMFSKGFGIPSARRNDILTISMVFMAIAIATILWAIIKVRNSKFCIALLVLLVLMSVAEGALGKFKLVTNGTNMY
jgi:hypothetical protein